MDKHSDSVSGKNSHGLVLCKSNFTITRPVKRLVFENFNDRCFQPSFDPLRMVVRRQHTQGERHPMPLFTLHIV